VKMSTHAAVSNTVTESACLACMYEIIPVCFLCYYFKLGYL